MSYLIYLTLEGNKQGLISSGCSTSDSIGNRFQKGHENQIQVLGLNHTMIFESNIAHHPVNLVKPIDKSSPLLGVAISTNESVNAKFDFFRTNSAGQLEFFYEIKLGDARIVSISSTYPHSLNKPDTIPYEEVQLRYKSIAWAHRIAGTSGYSVWHYD
jgi:type VI secretion system effector, Hcp1 family